MGAKRWGNALPSGQTEIEVLRTLLIEKGVLTDEEARNASRKRHPAEPDREKSGR